MKKSSFLMLALLLVLSLVACRQDDMVPTDEQIKTNEDSSLGELLFRDERISVYAAEDHADGALIAYGEYLQRLEEFNYSRPECTTWEMDADGDGIEELYLIHTIGSGTGVSVDALFVLEPNGDALDIYRHDFEDIQAQFNASCSGSYDPERQVLELSYGESSCTCDLSDFYNRDYIADATNLVLISGHMAEYAAAENHAVRLSFALSFESERITSLSSCLPEEAAVSCLIRFHGTGFELVDDLEFANASDES